MINKYLHFFLEKVSINMFWTIHQQIKSKILVQNICSSLWFNVLFFFLLKTQWITRICLKEIQYWMQGQEVAIAGIQPSQIESAPYSASNKLKWTCLTNQRPGFRMRPDYVRGIMNHYWTVVTANNEVSWRDNFPSGGPLTQNKNSPEENTTCQNFLRLWKVTIETSVKKRNSFYILAPCSLLGFNPSGCIAN